MNAGSRRPVPVTSRTARPGDPPSGAGRVQRRHPQMGRGRSRGTAPPRTSLLPSFHSILPPLAIPFRSRRPAMIRPRPDANTVRRDLAIRPGVHNEYHRTPIVGFDQRPHDCVEWTPNRVTRMPPTTAPPLRSTIGFHLPIPGHYTSPEQSFGAPSSTAGLYRIAPAALLSNSALRVAGLARRYDWLVGGFLGGRAMNRSSKRVNTSHGVAASRWRP
jgi:hypothetical protein